MENDGVGICTPLGEPQLNVEYESDLLNCVFGMCGRTQSLGVAVFDATGMC